MSQRTLKYECSWFMHVFAMILHGPSMFAVKEKIYGVSIISPAVSLSMKHLVIGQRQKKS